MYECCFCHRQLKGEAPYCIPEGFPNDPEHEGKPLCDACGGASEPTLDEICRHLDMLKRRERRPPAWPPRSAKRS